MASPSSTTPGGKPPRDLVQDALDANKRLQQILIQRAEQLEAELKEADSLLDAASADDTQDELEPEIVILGATKATSSFPPTEFSNPISPFYEEVIKRSNYLTNITVHPMKEKDLEVLADAVRLENQRLQAYKSRTHGPYSMADTTIDLDNNVEGLDWTKIAERVSDASSVKRTAIDCRVCWIGDRHPRVNHDEWAAPEVAKLRELVSKSLEEKSTVNWPEVAKQLGTNRTPLDCLRHGLPRQHHSWTTNQDQRLVDCVKSCGIGNWQLVAMNVSPHVTAAQCQNRWYKSLDPTLQRGNWTEEENDRLRKAVAGYGMSWVQVASTIPGRTNDQCRERWHEHLNPCMEKATWTEAEDKILLENVKIIGNRWKTISLIIGNNRTGPTCRQRYDKLIRSQKTRYNSTSVPPNTGPQPVSTTQASENGSSSMTQTQSCSLSVEAALPTVVAKPRLKPRARGKGKETIAKLQQNTGCVVSPSDDGSTPTPAGMTAPRPLPKPKPITRAKVKSTALEKARSTTPPSAVPSSENAQKTPRRGSKRRIDTQLDETPIPKKRRMQAPKPASKPADPTIASASVSPRSTDSSSPVADAYEIMEVEHRSVPTIKRTLRERKIATSAKIAENAGEVPVKRSRRRTRK